MKVIALDLATSTGWCCGNKGEIPKHGVENFSIDKSKGERKGKRFLNFHIWFRSLIKREKPDFVYFEAVKFHTSLDNGRVYGGLLSQVQLICEAEGIEYLEFDVNQIKKFARGIGCKMEKDKFIYEETEKGIKKSKCLTIATARQLGFKPICDDDADAICLWHLAIKGI